LEAFCAIRLVSLFVFIIKFSFYICINKNRKNKTFTEKMNRLTILNQLKLMNDQLKIIKKNEAEFFEKEGKRRLEERIDIILDRINYLKKQIKELDNGN
jgi:endo-alpha-1,4-polygalactosaminidase (GH114 family)